MDFSKIVTIDDAKKFNNSIVGNRIDEMFGNEHTKAIWLRRFRIVYQKMGRTEEFETMVLKFASNPIAAFGSVDKGIFYAYMYTAEWFYNYDLYLKANNLKTL